ncbi:MAG TPA: hypothetical protein VJN92_10635 [Candidatus Acidoferrum sp.]|nr:hypothetical protein [Candidatus Acidoferrum sp.]
MDQIAKWVQENWYELGSLAAQFTFLFAGLWFAGKILNTMRATQQQMGALLRLSMTNGLEDHSTIEERSKVSETIHEPTQSGVASPMLSAAMERSTSHSAFERPARTEMPSPSNGLNGRAKASAPIATAPMAEAPMMSTDEPTPYASAPLTLPEAEHKGHLGSAVQWLQTPMVNKRESGSPFKKVVRWLQAPAR